MSITLSEEQTNKDVSYMYKINLDRDLKDLQKAENEYVVFYRRKEV